MSVRSGIIRTKNLVSGFFDRVYDLAISLLDLVFGSLQRLLGVRGMPVDGARRRRHRPGAAAEASTAVDPTSSIPQASDGTKLPTPRRRT
mgnify:CR=1 FL=1